MKEKRVLHIVSWYPNKVSPNNGNFIEKHIRLLSDCFFNVVLFIQKDYTLKPFEQTIDHFTKDGLTVIIIYFGSLTIFGSKIEWMIFKLRAFYKGGIYVFKQFKSFDLIHNHVMIDAGLLAALLSKFKRIPLVITEHATLYQSENPQKISGLLRSITKFVAQQAKVIMPVSKDLANNLLQLGLTSDMEVVPNVANDELFVLEPKRVANDPIRLLHISNFRDQAKNITGLITGIKILQDKGHSFFFTFAGDGDLTIVGQQFNNLNISKDNYQLIGELSEEEVAKIMKEHDAFVLFSNFETFSVVTIEAQMVGLPVIATDIPVFQERIPSKAYGLIVPSKNVSALVEALELLIMRNIQFSPEKISTFAVQRYSTRAVRRQLLKIYDQYVWNKLTSN